MMIELPALKKMYYKNDGSKLGLKLLFDFELDFYILFNSLCFYTFSKEELGNEALKKNNYYDFEESRVHIDFIKEDEGSAYFIGLSNGDIIKIYQEVYSSSDWEQAFEIVKPKEDSSWYNEVVEHMNEEWIEELELIPKNKRGEGVKLAF